MCGVKRGLRLRGGHDSVSPEQPPYVERRGLESVEGALDRITAVTLTGGRRERSWPDGYVVSRPRACHHHPEQDRKPATAPLGDREHQSPELRTTPPSPIGEEATARHCRAVPEMPTDEALSVKSRVV